MSLQDWLDSTERRPRDTVPRTPYSVREHRGGGIVELGYVQASIIAYVVGTALFLFEERVLVASLLCALRWWSLSNHLATWRATLINAGVVNWRTQNHFIYGWANPRIPMMAVFYLAVRATLLVVFL